MVQDLSESVSRVRDLELVVAEYAWVELIAAGEPIYEQLTAVTVMQLDQTKTTDGKSNFLNMLVNAVNTSCPSALRLTDDLPTITDASRGTYSTYRQQY